MIDLMTLPIDNTKRTRLWDADYNLIYDSSLPGAVTPQEAIRNSMGERVNWTVDMLGNRWSGRVEWVDSKPNMVDDYEYLTKIMAYSNPLLKADTVG